jgi:tetratricopeptide (TPR) repeat protein
MMSKAMGISLLLVFFCGAVSLGGADEQSTEFQKTLRAALAAEQAGHRADAEKLFWAAFAEAKKLGPDDPHVAIALNDLAGFYFKSEETSKALELMKLVVAATEQRAGPVHARVATYLDNLAVSYESNNQDAEAEKCLEQAREIQDHLPDVPSWERVLILKNLAELHERQHRYAECEAELSDAVEILKNSSETYNQSELLRVEHWLATVHRMDGNEAESERLLDDVYDGTDAGRDGSPAAASLGRLQQADDERRAGKDLVSADAHYRQAIAGLEKLSPRNYSGMTAHAMKGLAEVCAAEGRDEEAEDLFKRALAMEEEMALHGRVPRAAARSLTPISHDLLEFYRDHGRLADMEPVYQQVLEIQKKVLGPDDDVLARTELELARLHQEEGENE